MCGCAAASPPHPAGHYGYKHNGYHYTHNHVARPSVLRPTRVAVYGSGVCVTQPPHVRWDCELPAGTFIRLCHSLPSLPGLLPAGGLSSPSHVCGGCELPADSLHGRVVAPLPPVRVARVRPALVCWGCELPAGAPYSLGHVLPLPRVLPARGLLSPPYVCVAHGLLDGPSYCRLGRVSPRPHFPPRS